MDWIFEIYVSFPPMKYLYLIKFQGLRCDNNFVAMQLKHMITLVLTSGMISEFKHVYKIT